LTWRALLLGLSRSGGQQHADRGDREIKTLLTTFSLGW